MKWIGAHSNNFGSRYGNKIDKIILHWIAGTLESCDSTFQDPNRKASAHYGVGDNEIHQYVKEEDCAWHAGNLLVNRQSIGIETEGSPTLPISEASYLTLAGLVKEIAQRYQIPMDRQHIKGHKEVSDKPTACPGTLDIDKVINLATEENMTEEQARILKFLEEQKATEGKVREAFGALNDLQTLKEEIDHLRSIVSDLQVQVSDLASKLAEKDKSVSDWQKEAKTAKESLENISELYSVAEEERKKFKRLYESALEKFPSEYSWKDIYQLIIKKIKSYERKRTL
jgi:N-acetyl-anhydromuramyl-L-alanine amidase AmpD